jgi:hypothetical protein
MGIKLDSIDKVRKNQKIPNEKILFLLYKNTARISNAKRRSPLSNVGISNKLLAIGTS